MRPSADPAETDLETQLTRLSGIARVAPLLRLAQLRSDRYLRLPTGSAAAGAALDPAVANLREARGLLPADDPGRLQVDGSLGWLLAVRYAGHGGSESDRDEAIELLAGSADRTQLAPMQRQGAFLMLGQLSALRALQLDPNGPVDPMKQSMEWMTRGMSARSRADLDRAHEYLSRVVREGPVNEQVRQAAEAMLHLVTMMRDMFAGVGSGDIMSNFTHLMAMMSRMGAPTGFGGGPAGFGGSPPGFGGSGQAPVWTPAMGMPTIVEGSVIPTQASPAREPAGRPSPERPAPARPAADRPSAAEPDRTGPLRDALIRHLAAAAGAAQTTDGATAAGPDTVVDLLRAVLRPDLAPVSAEVAEEAVALATAVHDAGGSRPADGLLLAVALWLRAGADDGGGWADDPGGSALADRRAGLEALVDAVAALPPDSPSAAAALSRGVAFLAEAPPLRGMPDTLLHRCADVCERVGHAPARVGPGPAADGGAHVGSAVGALAALCRAGLAARAGHPIDAGSVERVAHAVPAGDPWRFRVVGALGCALAVTALAAAETDAAAARRAFALMTAAGPGADGAARTIARLAELARAVVDDADRDGPGDRRHVLQAVAESLGAAATVGPRIAQALHLHGLDAVAVLHPVSTDGLRTLVVDRAGAVTLGDAVPEETHGRIALIAPIGLAALPRATAGDVLWTTRSVDRFLATAGDRPATIDAAPVFVANPAGDRDHATLEALALRRMLYPRSTGLGRVVEQIDGRGTPDEVLARLKNASMVHLGCAVRTTAPAAFGLAPSTGPAWLDIRRIQSGSGLAVLPADAGGDPVGLLAVADVLLDAGMSGVVHWLRPVPPPVATCMLTRLHEFLVDDRMGVPAAVAALRRWMRDPFRRPSRCVGGPPPADLTDPLLWGAIAYRR